MASGKNWFPPMAMTDEQKLQSLQAEMDNLNKLEEQYRQKQDVAASGFAPSESSDVPFMQRLAVKSFGTSPTQSVEYLKSKNPNMDFALKDGDIFAKIRGEAGPYKALDPEFSPISNPIQTLKDLPADIGDIGTDIVSGAAQGAATTIGSLPGILSFNPPAALIGASAASAGSGAALESARQGIGRLLGVNKEFSPEQIKMATGVGAVFPVAGVVAGKAAKAAAPYAKKALGSLIGMSKEEVRQMMENPSMFDAVKQAFKGTGSALETQQMARGSLKNLVKDLINVGLSEDEALNAALVGTNVNVDMKAIRQAFSQITDPRARAKAAALLNEARKYQIAQRPFQPEFATQEAKQMGVEGLTYPTKAVPSEAQVIGEVPDQMSFFEPETVMKPEYPNIPQPPKAPSATLLEGEKLVAPTEQDLIDYYKWKEAYDALSPRAKNPRTYRYNKDIKDMPVPPQEELLQTKILPKTPEEEIADLRKYVQAEEAIKSYEARFPQLKQAQAPELMLPPTPETVKVPPSMTAASSEFFGSEAAPMSTLLQEPLPFEMKKGIPAGLARQIRQRLQKEAKYSAQGNPSQRQFSDVADLINTSLREIPMVQAKEAAMGQGKDLQKALIKKAKGMYPIQFFENVSTKPDLRAQLEEAVTRASKAEKGKSAASIKQVQSLLGGAKKMAEAESSTAGASVSDLMKGLGGAALGHQYYGNTGAVLGSLAGLATSPKVLSKAIPAVETASKLPSVATNKYALPLWLELLKTKLGEEQ